MDKKRSKPKHLTIAAQGSPPKPDARGSKADGASAAASEKPNPKWREARIAYDESGNIVVLDKHVADRLRTLVSKDGTLELGFPDTDLRVEGAMLTNPLNPPPGGGVRPPNNQCGCGSLRLAVVAQDVPFLTQRPLF